MKRLFVALPIAFWTLPALAQPVAAPPSYIPIYAAVVTALFGFVGSWLGAQVALMSFRRQRAFDKQLDWYERASRSVVYLAERIQIAATEEDNKKPRERLDSCWREVQKAHNELSRTMTEGDLFASTKAVALARKIVTQVQDVANDTEGFDPHQYTDVTKKKKVELIYELSTQLDDISARLLREGRAHLGIDRDWRWRTWIVRRS